MRNHERSFRQLSRRGFLSLMSAAAVSATPLRIASAAATLTAAELQHALGGAAQPVLGYNNGVPGPTLSFEVGEKASIRVHNAMQRPTTVHWHGLRVPNAMDGVPGLTQAPIVPGGHFDYSFLLRNAGTYWYHPHFQSSEQLDRGLSGAIVVRGDDEPKVDRDVLWMLDDWRVDAEGLLVDNYGARHDLTHAGRIGNLVTVNGAPPKPLAVRRNERIRLRLVNAANARIFNLDFEGHSPRVIALDGHAVNPHVTESRRIVLGPSMRADLIIDADRGDPGARFAIRDVAYRRRAYTLTELVYEKGASKRAAIMSEPVALPPVDLVAPNLSAAPQHVLELTGGAMGGMRSARFNGRTLSARELISHRKAWALNGTAAHSHDMPALWHFELGSSHVVEIDNQTAWPHPLHLHGQPMLVLDGVPGSAPLPHWRDSVLIAPRSKARVAVLADNPGRWMLHCHIPEHQEAGMMSIVEVG